MGETDGLITEREREEERKHKVVREVEVDIWEVLGGGDGANITKIHRIKFSALIKIFLIFAFSKIKYSSILLTLWR